ncbi:MULTISPECIES: hypothetical protein [unclassified Sedimentibacter]|uniref:hypothetical protein n=1 Tax=unclassified Sedimentibacter TaxID=2649220 RepID=UPI0027E13566|nr:hypothetical protein [Sedimentibacter sp. MB35-C1]WMJ76540.1 hypothetical protein RBQ61_13225 [Sedimentibacter sp. MB35-C1]
MLSKIYGLLKFCYEDNSGDKLPDIKLQLFILGVKSLMPFEDNIGCMFDKERYEKEIELFSCYKNGNDDNLEYYYKHKKPSECDDLLLEYKIMPIIIANTQWDVLLNEALRATLFYSSSKKAILNTIILSSAIFEYLSKDDYIENMTELCRERLINFSFKDFLKYNNMKVNKISLIEFEKERIKMLSENKLMADELMDKFKSLQYLFNVEEKIKTETSEETVLSSFSSYLYKLRKGIINPEKLKVSHCNIPDVKELLKYSSFTHPFLGKCLVIKRGKNEVILRNKSGLMKVNI